MADRIGKPISQRQLRVGELIKQSLSMIFIKNEAKDTNGRFNAGLPRVSDGALLFLQTLVHKMESDGSRIGIIFNGSPLTTGDADSGESNIRKWLVEKDLVEKIERFTVDRIRWNDENHFVRSI